MKYATIPHGIRKSITNKVYRAELNRLKDEFTTRFKPRIKVGDTVILPRTIQRLWDGWEVFDPTSFSFKVPETATVAEVFACSSWLEHKYEGHYGIHDTFAECESEDAIRQVMNHMAHFEEYTNDYRRKSYRIRKEPPFYYTCRLTGVPFTWCVPEEFLTVLHTVPDAVAAWHTMLRLARQVRTIRLSS